MKGKQRRVRKGSPQTGGIVDRNEKDLAIRTQSSARKLICLPPCAPAVTNDLEDGTEAGACHVPQLTAPFHFKVRDRGKVCFISSTQGSNKVPLILLSLPARSLCRWYFPARLCKANIERPFFKCQLRSCFLPGIKRLDFSQKIYRHLFQILSAQLNRHSACSGVGLIIQCSGDKVLASGVCQKFCIRVF